MFAAAGSGQSYGDATVTFSGFQIYDSPGVLAQGATAVIDYTDTVVPEPSTGLLMLAVPVLLLLRRGPEGGLRGRGADPFRTAAGQGPAPQMQKR
jgi:hypothetical protein